MARPKLEFVPTGESRALVYKIDRDLWPVYHYHPEIDILLILKNHGEFISGAYIGHLEPGTLIMNGPNIPHALHATEKDEHEWSRPAVVVIQFSRKSLGENWLAKIRISRTLPSPLKKALFQLADSELSISTNISEAILHKHENPAYLFADCRPVSDKLPHLVRR